MKPFGCRVIGFDKYQPPGCERGAGYKRAASLKELLAASDAISLHCLLTEETAGMVDEAFLGAMKPGAILVNTARGGLFKNLDVIEAGLRSGQLGGLGTDVLPAEPPGEHPLIDAWRGFEPWLKGRLVITPHTAYYSESALYDMRHKAAETVVLFFNTNELRNRIV
jgi:D-3-phosphoglycerate dehydrogenase